MQPMPGFVEILHLCFLHTLRVLKSTTAWLIIYSRSVSISPIDLVGLSAAHKRTKGKAKCSVLVILGVAGRLKMPPDEEINRRVYLTP